jgi:hypothetical protein
MREGPHEGERERRPAADEASAPQRSPRDEPPPASEAPAPDDDWGDVQVGRWSRPTSQGAPTRWERDEGAWGGTARWRYGEGSGVEAETAGGAAPRGRFVGVGPKGYRRSDERIRDDVCDRLTCDPDVDPSGVTVVVAEAEVTLEGPVDSAWARHRIRSCAEATVGVRGVHDRMHVAPARPRHGDDSA